MFNLVSGLTTLIASVVAGMLWDVFGAASTFQAGAVFCMVALAAIPLLPARQQRRDAGPG